MRPRAHQTALLETLGASGPAPLEATARARRGSGLPVRDLTSPNPYDAGFRFPEERLETIAARAVRAAFRYAPDARGQQAAREAVAAWHGGAAQADHILLTPGTSFAYFLLFRLLARPGAEVLVPQPGYPLFEDLARLAGVGVRYYHLAAQGRGWQIDAGEVAFQMRPQTVAVVVVSPHNPTGHVATRDELTGVARTARARGVPVIFDEVFREFTLRDGAQVPRPADCGAALSVTLNGLSKMAALPGWKAGWMVFEGEPDACAQWMRAAEYAADAFLAVHEVTQAALPELLAAGTEAAAGFRELLRARMTAAVEALRAADPDLALPDAGPYLLVEPPGVCAADWCERLVREEGLLLHPGGYYALPRETLVLQGGLAAPEEIVQLAAVLAQWACTGA